MTRFFITGTGTGVGKTFVTCALTWQLRRQGRGVKAVKPVISGFEAERLADSDTGQLLQVQSMELTQASMKIISPWRFSAPLSPDMAAQDEGKAIDFDQLLAFCQEQEGDSLLIEGIGGIMTPLTAHHTVIDWIKALGIPAILVTGSYVGALSHALTSCEALLAHGVRIHAVIISESEGSIVTLQRTRETLQRFLPRDVPVHVIARLDSLPELWKYAPDITSVIA